MSYCDLSKHLSATGLLNSLKKIECGEIEPVEHFLCSCLVPYLRKSQSTIFRSILSALKLNSYHSFHGRTLLPQQNGSYLTELDWVRTTDPPESQVLGFTDNSIGRVTFTKKMSQNVCTIDVVQRSLKVFEKCFNF